MMLCKKLAGGGPYLSPRHLVVKIVRNHTGVSVSGGVTKLSCGSAHIIYSPLFVRLCDTVEIFWNYTGVSGGGMREIYLPKTGIAAEKGEV